MHITDGSRRSVHLWRRSYMLCTSGFMDDVIFAHTPRLLDAEAQCTRSLAFGYKLCAVIPVVGQRTHVTTLRALKVSFHVATQGVYDCLVDHVNKMHVGSLSICERTSWRCKLSVGLKCSILHLPHRKTKM